MPRKCGNPSAMKPSPMVQTVTLAGQEQLLSGSIARNSARSIEKRCGPPESRQSVQTQKCWWNTLWPSCQPLLQHSSPNTVRKYACLRPPLVPYSSLSPLLPEVFIAECWLCPAGGLINSALIACPGASRYYAGGACLYSAPAMRAFIPTPVLRESGVMSKANYADKETYVESKRRFVLAMARHGRAQMRTTWCGCCRCSACCVTCGSGAGASLRVAHAGLTLKYLALNLALQLWL